MLFWQRPGRKAYQKAENGGRKDETAGELCPKMMIWTQFSLQLIHSSIFVMSFITYEAISSLFIIITHNKTRKDVSAQNGKPLAQNQK